MKGGVYVDAAVWPYGRMMMCHLLVDNVEDLHEMAAKVGVRHKWFQNKRYPHYDICKAKRALAVKFGAIEIGREQFVALARKLTSATPASPPPKSPTEHAPKDFRK